MIASIKIIAICIYAIVALYFIAQNFIEIHKDKRKLTENIISNFLIVLIGVAISAGILQG